MAAEVAELDLIVGGHSHTFLFTGKTLPSIEKPEGNAKMTSNKLSFSGGLISNQDRCEIAPS